jgi:hypothetical protein
MAGNGGQGCSLCRIINLLISLAFLGAGGYMIWFFLGKPDVEDVQGFFDDFDGFGDFTDVLRYVFDSIRFDSMLALGVACLGGHDLVVRRFA